MEQRTGSCDNEDVLQVRPLDILDGSIEVVLQDRAAQMLQ